MFFFFPFFKHRKPRQFNYHPLHYDPAQEAREQRRRAMLGADAVSPLEKSSGTEGGYQPGQYIRGGGLGARHGYGRSAKSTPAQRHIIRLVIILILLLGIAYWIITTT